MSRSTFDPNIALLRMHILSPPSEASSAPAKPSTVSCIPHSTYENNQTKEKSNSLQVDSRVMVDFDSYFRFGPSVACVGSLKASNSEAECSCLDCRENDALREAYRTRFDEESNQKDHWEEDQYMLCPPRVLGYILRDKQWAQLQVTLLQDIPEKDPSDSWSNRLKLADGEETKDMILSLVTGHGTTESAGEKDGLEVDDIIAKKGKGLVILLYGMDSLQEIA